MELLAPNNKPSNLTEQQYRLVRTPEFKAWFGDWELLYEYKDRYTYKGHDRLFGQPKIGNTYDLVDGTVAKILSLDTEKRQYEVFIDGKKQFVSWKRLNYLYSGTPDVFTEELIFETSKVIDENYEPLVVWHGSENLFNIFDEQKIGSNTGSDRKKGFYFSSKKEVAETFIRKFKKDELGFEVRDGYVMPYFVKLNNPNYLDLNKERGQNIMWADKFISENDGNRGFVIYNAFDTVGDLTEKSTVIIVPDSEKIKLADGSNTTFDGSNPDIRYEKGGGVDSEFKHTLREVYENVFLLEMPSQYDLASAFARSQAFYEWDEFKGKEFKIEDYFKWFEKNYPELKTYQEEFYGFNLPSDVIDKCYKVNKERTNYDEFFLNIITEIKKKSDKFYLIGAVTGDERTINHELAHSFFWSDNKYKSDMTKLVNAVPNKSKFLSILKNDRGYGEDVLIDEVQAFMSTGLIVDINDWEKDRKPFIERFNKQKESVLTESFGKGGEFNPKSSYQKFLDELIKKTTLNENQLEVIKTREFKDWFGDWENDPANASKVVDKEGLPLMVYRGGSESEDYHGHEFKLGLNLLQKPYPNLFGHFFTANYNVADRYFGGGFRDKGHLYRVFLNIKNLLDIRELGDKASGQNFIDALTKKGVDFSNYENLKNEILNYEAKDGYRYDTWDYWDVFPKLREVFIQNGFDGVVFKDNSTEAFGDLAADTYVVFESNQIKLADNTTFYSNNPDVRFGNGGEIEEYLAKGGELKFYSDCVGYPVLSDLEHIIDNEKEIKYNTFVANVNKEDRLMLERKLGYGKDFPITKDWHVRFFRSKDEDNNTVYFIRHSAIEYVFSPKGGSMSCGMDDDYKNGGAITENEVTKIGNDIYISRDISKLPKDAIIVEHRYHDKIKAGELGIFTVKVGDNDIGYGKNIAYISIGKNAKVVTIGSSENYLDKNLKGKELEEFNQFILNKYRADRGNHPHKDYKDFFGDAGILGNPSTAWYELEKKAIEMLKREHGEFDVLEMLYEDENTPHQYLILNVNDPELKFNNGGILELTENNPDKLIKKYYENNIETDIEGNEYLLDDIKNSIKNSIYVFDNVKNKKQKLYRAIQLKENNSINYNNIGRHFVKSKDDITDNFLANIGLDRFSGYADVVIFEILPEYDDIDIEYTLFHNVNYPTEFEITLKENANINITGIYKYNDNKPSSPELVKSIEKLLNKRFNYGGQITSIKSNDFVVLKYIDDDKQLGFLEYYFDTNGVISIGLDKAPFNFNSEMYISIVEVEEQYRGKGIAKKLINEALKYAKELGIEVITLRRDAGMGCNYGSDYDNYLKKIYSSVGFVETWTQKDVEESNGDKNICGMHLVVNENYKKGGSLINKTDIPDFYIDEKKDKVFVRNVLHGTCKPFQKFEKGKKGSTTSDDIMSNLGFNFTPSFKKSMEQFAGHNKMMDIQDSYAYKKCEEEGLESGTGEFDDCVSEERYNIDLDCRGILVDLVGKKIYKADESEIVIEVLKLAHKNNLFKIENGDSVDKKKYNQLVKDNFDWQYHPQLVEAVNGFAFKKYNSRTDKEESVLDVKKACDLFIQKLKKEGYDIIQYRNEIETDYKFEYDFIVFDEKQIKYKYKIYDRSDYQGEESYEAIKYNNGGLIAPNGKKSKLTEQQYKLVRTPEFKAWFGDWENDTSNASKVVDENGEPLVVNHTYDTENAPNVFQKSKEVYIDGKYKRILENDDVYKKLEGIYGTTIIDGVKYNIESDYWEFWFTNKVFGGGSNLKYISCFLNIRNLYVNENGYGGQGSFGNMKTDYDGISGVKITNADGQEGVDYYIVLFSNQIKLADGSNTTFDGSNPDIRFGDGGSLTDTEVESQLKLRQRMRSLLKLLKYKTTDDTGMTKEDKFIERVIALIYDGKDFKSKLDIESIAEKEFDFTDKRKVRELTEYAVLYVGREIAKTYGNDIPVAYKKMVSLYSNQPYSTHRTSTSVELGQFSTPAPMAYLMGCYVGINKNDGKTFFESCAGNGMLTVAGKPQDFVVNELDMNRYNNLLKEPYKLVLNQDANKKFNFDYKFDGLLANPPFATTKTDVVVDGFHISGLEQQIIVHSLTYLKNEAKIAFIIGGHTEFDESGRIKSKKDRAFLSYLFKNYYMDDVINISGSLYGRQGTTYPIRIILLAAKKSKPEGYFPLENKNLGKFEPFSTKVIENFDELFKRTEKYMEKSL